MEDSQRVHHKRRTSDNTPWYVSASYKLGVPAIIALMFAWAYVSKIEPEQERLNNMLSAHIQITDKLTGQNETIINLLRTINMTMQQNCVNVATTTTDRNACFR